MQRRYLTPKEAVDAGYFGSVHTAAWLRWQGKGPSYIKLGSGPKASVRYRIEDLEAWMLGHQVSTEDCPPSKESVCAPAGT